MNDSDAEREHEPTERKLAEARKRGELVRSADVNVAAAYGGLLIAAVGLGVAGLRDFGTGAMVLLDQADSLAPLLLGGETGPLGGLLGTLLLSVMPFFLAPMGFVLATLMVQRAIVFAPEKLEIKLSRINPLANAKQKFGRSGLFEFAKSFAKLVIIALLLGVFLASRMPRIVLSQEGSPGMAVAELGSLIVEFLFLMLLIAGSIGAIDYLWQRAEHLRRHRMTRQELLDELKQSDGDPQLKGQRRRRAVEIATNQMLADVAKADVVIVNPTHFAVALQWKRGSLHAPICLAKGVDEVAARIRERAVEAAIPIHSDPPTARAIYATVGLGQEIRPEHFKAVAAAIRFAERIRRRARERNGI
ncbi:flagellar biosynthesis protein FlhB [Phaeovulum sp.]|uniref:EscU/YscU/HrcU family type III secretion system export apparatus switch protein n=1 Tax=Phaeovulum sp. TaxID=2934796 RepID=UPI00356ADE27